MSETQVIDLAVSQAEASSIAEIASLIVNETANLADRYDAQLEFDIRKVEEDLIVFLTKRKQTKLTRLRVTILEDGSLAVGEHISGQRRADLIFNIFYKPKGAVVKA